MVDIAGLVTKIISGIWEAWAAIQAFFSSPQIDIVPSESEFGRLDGWQFALLLKVSFRNESERPFLLRSLRVQYRDVWHNAERETPTHWNLLLMHGWRLLNPYRPAKNLERALRIPPVEVVERFAFFRLIDPGEALPERLEITVEARFSRGRSRKATGTVSAPRKAKEG